ncbi:hypothetical protein ACIBG0_37100 [Nocardia sp. NPDC050630]|uniref:hypothetical protein n=1 Tax=Nocardia sp. NPDC050630 TaxID=3364321 RepID=UPI0037B8ECCE
MSSLSPPRVRPAERIRTARLLNQPLTARSSGPIFLSRRTAPDDGTIPTRDIDLVSRRRRMNHRTAERYLAVETSGWDPHNLRHSRLTHAGEDSATDTDLMNLSGHEDRRPHPHKRALRRRFPHTTQVAEMGGSGCHQHATLLGDQDRWRSIRPWQALRSLPPTSGRGRC